MCYCKQAQQQKMHVWCLSHVCAGEEEVGMEPSSPQRPGGHAGLNQGAAAALRARLQGSAGQAAPAGKGLFHPLLTLLL